MRRWRIEGNRDLRRGPSRTPTLPGGFTLVELLVVIAVIAVLIGVLLPGLFRARQKGFLVASMNNMRQVTAGALAYTYEHEEKWPVVPIPDAPPGQILFDSWQYGGKTTSDYWKTTLRGYAYHTIEERVLNPYVLPEVEMIDPPDGTRRELELFRCPADRLTYQRGYWRGERPEPISSYDDVGTSYHMNMNWWYASAKPGESSLERWRRTEPIFRRGGLGGPSRFVWLYDQIMDVVAIYGSSVEGDHGGLNRAKAAYQDGHVEYVTVQPEASKTTEYWLHLD